MAKAFRVDHGSLRKPSRTPQGFLRVDGYASRIGVFEYLNEDGSIRRELRLPEEVFREDALAGFEGAPLTDGHPPVMVTAENVAQYEKGTVTARAWRDGDFVVTSIVIKDPKLIRKVERGDTGLSVGYSVDLDETPGVHPQFGRYDAIQRNLVINHLAAAVTPRAGNAARIRMDGAAEQRADGLARLTSSVDGHQHLIDLQHDYGPGMSGQSGCTSWAVAEGADVGHEHPWVRAPDGTITIGEAAGHTHTILDETRYAAPRADQQIDRDRAVKESGAMKTPEELQARIDELGGENKTLKARIAELEALIATNATAAESEAVKKEKQRADEAEAKVKRFDETFATAVRARAKLEREAGRIMGAEFRMDDMTDRAIHEAVVKRLDASTDVKSVSDAELRGQYNTLVALAAKNVESQQRVGEIMSRTRETERKDEGESYEEYEKNRWKTTLKNGRDAAEGR